MCLILFAHRVHPRFPLILAANRDEAYARPAARPAFWEDHPGIYGGRDLDRGGSWLAMTRTGKIAAVTNYRNALAPRDAPRSRGDLVKDYLAGDADAASYLRSVEGCGALYNGFILIAGDLDALHWLSNRGPGAARIRLVAVGGQYKREAGMHPVCEKDQAHRAVTTRSTRSVGSCRARGIPSL